MPDVAFKDLCIDVTDAGERPARVARFWGAALGQPVEALPDGDFRLAPPDGGPDSRQVWINRVPEPIAGKSRVHLDVRLPGGDPAPLVAAGGTVRRVPDGEVHWHVLDDPDGVALCVMGAHPMAPDGPWGPFELVVDAVDPLAQATWWAARTGGTVGRREEGGFAWVESAAGFPWMFWVFAPVPEPKTAKNRVHWDVNLVDTDVDGLVATGATVLRRRDGEIRWTVMADPEGNEFCAFAQF